MHRTISNFRKNINTEQKHAIVLVENGYGCKVFLLYQTQQMNKSENNEQKINKLKAFNKEAHEKNCRFRTESGFCIKSQRQCPATLFVTLKN
ncbi:MAG TPA: hypothetical protein PL045_04080 [Chitinophagaceae bacterium]|nr:hypothetical protein [Chitinophagaceae bacterium]